MTGTTYTTQKEMIQKQATAYFAKATSRSLWTRFQQMRNGRSTLPALSAVPANAKMEVVETTVNVNDIVGSLNPGRAQDFDAEFRPNTQQTRERWIAVANILLSGRNLPPVELVKTASGYYITDGHHRVSVSKAIGRDQINAIVVSC